MNYVADTGVVAVIVGLVSAAKYAGLPARWSPLLSIVLGVAVDMAFKSTLLGAVSVGASVFYGIVSGLTASGVYSGAKATFTSTTTNP